MTVQELLADLLKRYPGANPEALASFKSVFYARLGKREGPHLQAAFDECCASFKPTFNQPFPVPANIEQHMPALRSADDGGAGNPIREALQRRHDRARALLAEWEVDQGAKIQRERAPELYAACWLEAFDQARQKALDDRVQRLILDQATINLCFKRAIGIERAHRGRLPAAPAQWWQQVEEIARRWGLQITPGWWSAEASKALEAREAA